MQLFRITLAFAKNVSHWSTILLFLFFLQLSKSGKEEVQLSKVTLASSGRYKCEVLAESPQFTTLVKSDELQVVGEYCRSGEEW